MATMTKPIYVLITANYLNASKTVHVHTGSAMKKLISILGETKVSLKEDIAELSEVIIRDKKRGRDTNEENLHQLRGEKKSCLGFLEQNNNIPKLLAENSKLYALTGEAKELYNKLFIIDK